MAGARVGHSIIPTEILLGGGGLWANPVTCHTVGIISLVHHACGAAGTGNFPTSLCNKEGKSILISNFWPLGSKHLILPRKSGKGKHPAFRTTWEPCGFQEKIYGSRLVPFVFLRSLLQVRKRFLYLVSLLVLLLCSYYGLNHPQGVF